MRRPGLGDEEKRIKVGNLIGRTWYANYFMEYGILISSLEYEV